MAVIVLNLDVLTPIGNATPIEKGILLFCGICFVLTRKKNAVVLALIAIMALATMVSAWGTDFPGFSIDRYFRGLVSLLAPWFLLAARPIMSDRVLILRLSSWMPIATIALGVMYDVAGIHSMFYVDFLGVSRLQGTTISAGLGSICYIGAFAASVRWADDRRWGNLVLTAINFVILLLTAARAPFFLAVLAVGSVYIFRYRHTIFSVTTTVFALPVAAIAAFVVLGGALMARFLSQSLSGREMIWTALQDVANAYPYFGIGLGHQILVVPPMIVKLTATVAAHNEYLRLVVECGYPGAAIIFACIAGICLYLWASRTVKFNMAFLIPVVTFFVYCNSDNAISSSVTPLIVVLAYFSFAPNVSASRQQAKPIAPARTIFPKLER